MEKKVKTIPLLGFFQISDVTISTDHYMLIAMPVMGFSLWVSPLCSERFAQMKKDEYMYLKEPLHLY